MILRAQQKASAAALARAAAVYPKQTAGCVASASRSARLDEDGWLTPKGYMRNSAKPGMIDDPKMYESYALYLSKYVSAYKAAGCRSTA